MSGVDIVLGHINLSILLTGLTLGLLTYYIYNRLKYRLPPGPWYIPLIGNYKIYTQNTMHRIVAELSDQYGPVVSIAAGPVQMVFLNRIDVVLEALVSKKTDFATRPFMTSLDVFSAGSKDIVFAPYSTTWQYQKKVAGKALRYYMQGSRLEDVLSEVCVKVFEKMSKEKKPFAAKDYMAKMVIHMLFNMCFGRKCNLDDPDVEFMLNASNGFLEKFGTGFFEDIIPSMTKVYKTKRFREYETIVDDIIAFIEKVLKEHKETFDPANVRDYIDCVLLVLQEAEENKKDVEMLTDTHIAQIVSNIYFGSFDNTRMTLDWFISFMLQHPNLQAKCQEEINETVGSRTPCATDRPNLSFTEACIMECMRLGSVTPIGVPHATTRDTSVGGYDIQKGTTVIINFWALLHDPTFWKDVDKFDPYRYLDDQGKLDKTPANWLPFSAGKRVCPAESISRMELFLIVSNLLQNFTFKVPPGVTHKCEATCPIAAVEIPRPYKVVIEPRK